MVSGPASHASQVDQDGLDMNAADSALNAPYAVDSRFLVSASRLCAETVSDSVDILRASGSPEIRQIARTAAATCSRVGLMIGSLERQKGWTLPPPGSSLYGPVRTRFSDRGYLASLAAQDRATIVLLSEEIAVGRDQRVKALAQREMESMRRELASIETVDGGN
jgi:hypothetical protein